LPTCTLHIIVRAHVATTLEAFAMPAISTPDLSDAHPEAQALELQLQNYGAITRFCGQAVTIKCHEDNSLVKQCVGEAGAGRVIVVDGGGSLRRALLGDMLAEQAAANGWAGLVINGAVRDVDEIAVTSIGVQALGRCALKTEKLGVGQRDVPVSIGAVTIDPGDYIYADNNGVIVSKQALL
jgi:regulator of ribonuclease activity A